GRPGDRESGRSGDREIGRSGDRNYVRGRLRAGLIAQPPQTHELFNALDDPSLLINGTAPLSQGWYRAPSRTVLPARATPDPGRLSRPAGASSITAPPPPHGTLALNAAPSRAADFRVLLKPGISIFVTVTAAAGYLFGATAGIDLPAFVALLA